MDRLKPKRTARRALLTKLVNEAKAALQSTPPDLVSLQSVLQRLTTCEAELRAINTEMEPLIPTELLEAELETVLQYEDEALNAISSLNTVIESLNSPTA